MAQEILSKQQDLVDVFGPHPHPSPLQCVEYAFPEVFGLVCFVGLDTLASHLLASDSLKPTGIACCGRGLAVRDFRRDEKAKKTTDDLDDLARKKKKVRSVVVPWSPSLRHFFSPKRGRMRPLSLCNSAGVVCLKDSNQVFFCCD